MMLYGQKRCKYHNTSPNLTFYLKGQTTKTSLYHKGSHTLTLKVEGKKQGLLSKGWLVHIKIKDFLES